MPGVNVRVGWGTLNKSHPLDADHLVFTQQPSDGVSAPLGLGVQPIVAAKNTLGITVTGYVGTCTLAIASGTGGTVSNNTVSFIGGLATFINFAFPTGNSTYTVQATSGILTPSTSASFTTDVLALVAALGGDSAVAAIYTVRINLVISGSNFISLDEARKNTGGPTLPQIAVVAGAPQYDAVNKVITTTSASCGTATDAAFDLTQPRTVYSIVRCPTNGSTFVSINNGGGKWLNLFSQSGFYATYFGSISVDGGFMISPTALGTTKRLCVMGIISATSQPKFDVMGSVGPNVSYVNDVINAAYGAGPYQFQIGTSPFGGGAAQWSSSVITSRDETSSDRAFIARWTKAYEGAVEDTSASRYVLFDGDSRTWGTKAVNGTSDFVTVLMATTGFTTDRFYANLGVPSRKLSLMESTIDLRFAAVKSSTATKKIAVLLGGYNDYAFDGLSGAQVYALQKSWATKAKALGITKTIVCTVYGSGTLAGAGELARVAGNLLLTTASGGLGDIDMVIDIASIPQLLNPLNTSFFDVDTIHPIAPGYAAQDSDATNGMAVKMATIW